jgi:hypothetical protein
VKRGTANFRALHPTEGQAEQGSFACSKSLTRCVKRLERPAHLRRSWCERQRKGRPRGARDHSRYSMLVGGGT